MATFRIIVTIDPTGAERGSRKVERSLNRVGNAANRTRNLIAKAFAFAGGAAVITRSIGLLANFEQQMSTVRAISNATASQFADLTEEAKRLGITTRFSASQAAEGMVFLARAGFEVDEVLGSIQGTLRLAQAGALELGSAADIASNILQGFRLAVDQTGRVVDVLALAANSANTTVEQLGQGMKFVAPVAAGLGVSLEDTTAAMAALSNAGLQATMAGTGLRRVMSELESPSKKTTDILASLGLAAEDVRISQVGLVETLQRLAVAGVDTGQALEIFGDRGGPAFEVLSSSIPDVIKMTEELGKAGGTAKRVADIMDDNLNGAILATRSALEGLVLELGEGGATGALRTFFETLTVGLRTMAAEIDTVIRAIDALVIALSVHLARKAIPAVIRGVNALTLAIAANPLGALLVAVTASISLLVAFKDQIGISGDSIATLGDLAQATFEAIANNLRGLRLIFTINFFALQAFMEKTFGDMEFSIESVLRVTARVVDGIVGLFKGAGNAIGITFGEVLPNNLKAAFGTLFNDLSRFFTGFLNNTIRGINLISEAVGGPLLDELKAFQVEAPEFAKDAGARIDQAVADGIKNQHAAEDALNDIIARAEVLAAIRTGSLVPEDIVPGGISGGDLVPKEQAPDGGVSGAQTIIDPEFTRVLELLEKEGELLRFNSQEREIQMGLLAAEKTLKRDLTATERERLTAQLQVNQALEDESRILDEIQGPTQEYERSLEALDRLLMKGAISTGEFADKQRDLREALLETQTDMVSGFERGLLKLSTEFDDFASLAEGAMVDAFKGAEDALVQFVTTGKLDFASLAESIIADLARMAIRAAIVRPLFSFLSGMFLGGQGLGTPGASAAGAGTPFSTGGLVSGPGGPTSDLVPAQLSNGEFVINAAMTRKFLPLLEAINSGQTGGLARPSTPTRAPARASGGGNPRNAGGTVVQIFDQRSSKDSEPVETRETTGADGRKILTVLIRDTVRRDITNGNLDGAARQRWGITPPTLRRS